MIEQNIHLETYDDVKRAMDFLFLLEKNLEIDTGFTSMRLAYRTDKSGIWQLQFVTKHNYTRIRTNERGAS